MFALSVSLLCGKVGFKLIPSILGFNMSPTLNPDLRRR